jgi:2-C-methyl-D-erythritol 4-phosphate cytidylyltransferase
MAGQTKKEYMDFQGKPVLVCSIAPFMTPPSFTPIIVTVPVSGIDEAKNIVAKHIDVTEILFVEGGSSRQASVFRALSRMADFAPNFVLIHDAARPWVSRKLIDDVTKNTIQYGACIPVVRALDALKALDESGFITTHLGHDRIRGAQTPQGFAFGAILKAHTMAALKGVEAPDDAELYGLYEGRVFTIPGEPENRKITYIHDIQRFSF